MKNCKRLATLALALVLAFVLTACGAAGDAANSSDVAETAAESTDVGGGEESNDTATDGEGAGAAEDAAEGEASEAQPAGLFGKPWVTSMLQGNLPVEEPEAKDDLYTHYAYDYLVTHQNESTNPNVSAMADHAGELKDTVVAAIKDESKTGHDLEQLRIFYDQAADTDALEAAGLSEVQPYLDRIDAVTSLDDLNALVAADDFPFSPFITAVIRTNDTRATNDVGLYPNFLFSNAIVAGGTSYEETDDTIAQQSSNVQLAGMGVYVIADLEASGMDSDSALEASKQLMEFEKSHGKYLAGGTTYVKADFGAMAEDARANTLTLDELCDLSPNYPIKETLTKLGKDGSKQYSVSRKWLEAFNDVWTAEHVDDLKLMAKAKVLDETRPYRAPAKKSGEIEIPEVSADAFAYTACNSLNTFAQVLAKTYVDEGLPARAKERLTELSQRLIDTYKDLVGNTEWMGEKSRQRVEEKLEHMAINVLEPEEGYFDYGGLELVPSDKGGTLLSNYLICKQYRYDCEEKLVGQPAIKAPTWYMIEPTTMNAFYDLESNSINIVPGFVTSLLYADDMSNEDLLGGVGFTIAHEISHGFDYQGAQMDAYGRPEPVFDEADVDAFVSKISVLAQYYSGIELHPEVVLDGQVVVAEAAADLSGMQAILEIARTSDDFDYQRFFDNMCKTWAQVIPRMVFPVFAADTHPLAYLRINVNSQMFDPLYDTFGVVEGDGMYLAPDKRIVMWGPNA